MTPKREPNNADRAKRGDYAIREYVKEYGDADDDATNLRDLLTDLMHYTGVKGFDFKDELQIAERNFWAEVEEEEIS